MVRTQGPRATMVRPLRPTDLVALAAFETKAFPNEVRTYDCLAGGHRRPLAIATVLEQWLVAEDRHTLVAPSGLGIKGLISARHRAGREAWEVDWLVLAPDGPAPRRTEPYPAGQPTELFPAEAGPHPAMATGAHAEDEAAAQALLDGMAEAAVKAQVQRVFLRLPQASPLVSLAPRSGFVLYGSETLLRGRAPDRPLENLPGLELRPRRKVDELGIFRLYHSAVPPQVRSMEGMTLEEWRATRDDRFWQQREYVWSERDRIRAWLQVNRGGGDGQFRLLIHPEDEGRLNDIVGMTLTHLLRKKAVRALVPHFQPSLRSLLEEVWGFDEVAEYQNLARHLAVRVPEARLVPVRA
jgi:hypothetical protein